MKSIVKTHWLAIVVSVFVGLFHVLPSVFFTFTPDYAGVMMVGPADEEHYVARTQQAYIGHPLTTNTFLQNKDQPYFQPGLGESIVAGLARITGLSATQMIVVSKFLFPFLVALIIYAFVYALFASVPVALMAVLCVFFADNLTSSGASTWLRLLQGQSPEGWLPYARPVNPQISGLLFFGTLYLLYRTFWNRDIWRTGAVIGIGLLIGAASYLNPYNWTFFIVFFGLFFLWCLYRKEYKDALNTVYIGAISLLVSIPFFFNYWQLLAHPDYVESAARFGIIATHAPIIGAWVILLFLCPLLLWPKEYARAKSFFIISAIAIFLLLNQQVITGHLMQQNHYHFYDTKPLAEIMFAMYIIVIGALLVRHEKLRISLYAAIALFFFYNGALIQYHSYLSSYPLAAAAQKYAPLLSYLEALPQNETIWADRNLSTYIPMYTAHSVPNNFYAFAYLTSNKYLEKRILLEYRLRGVPPSQAYDTLVQDRADVSSRIFQLYWREKTGSYAGIPDSLLRDYAKDYATFVRAPYPTLFRDMGITMIAWDKNAEPAWNINAMPFVSKIFEIGDIVVFRLQ
ncbi:MAG TPA: hypothetical protein VJG64_02760 [Candidatus Paceibacterota bacterium]